MCREGDEGRVGDDSGRVVVYVVDRRKESSVCSVLEVERQAGREQA